ncbi:putative membrane protein YphA (DoxX/SURF4 family) [Halopolyspora algeriensis]|uniref:Putative membrane protein YphA (DoxX/SURF4 family) n=1 Tax=Halopolyspora algeriensis TaxID=1500506 RepID=A0A368VZ83_9ACTN|nr:DoxX family protein [Halopolyspora algeriensis]RCW47317.1 putative membrane protein YphA (DoxX/SURF4 family) [Halopolyspora algeriensis]TQM42552.1 putative membrane protein YphA (DoxX/SURF4 family) [Halopolyspora algeriensis]
MLIRRLARPMLASIFIYGGIGALRDTEGHAKAATPWLDKTVGQVKDSVPEQVPTDPETLVKVDGAVKVGAGAMLALGKFPRLSALLLTGSLTATTLSQHAYWEYEDAEQRAMQQTQFIKNLSLLGGLLIASVDTAGKPSVGYRARYGAQRLTDQAQLAGQLSSKQAQKAQKKAQKQGMKQGAKTAKTKKERAKTG